MIIVRFCRQRTSLFETDPDCIAKQHFPAFDNGIPAVGCVRSFTAVIFFSSEEDKMKICYFTATGNCLYVAKQIGGELLSIPQLIIEANE